MEIPNSEGLRSVFPLFDGNFGCQPLVWTITCSFQPILVDTLGPYMAIPPFWLVKSKLLVVKPTVLGSQINFFGGSITLKPLVLARSNYLINAV
jgi:hypothetical protein